MGIFTPRKAVKRQSTNVSYTSSQSSRRSSFTLDEKDSQFLAKIAVTATDAEVDGMDNENAAQVYAYLERKNIFDDDDEYENRSAVLMKNGAKYQVQSQVDMPELQTTAIGLDAKVLIVVDNPLVHSVFVPWIHNKIAPNVNVIKLGSEAESTLQIFDSMAQVVRARLDQPQVFVREEQLLFVWADTAHRACNTAIALQNQILEIVWNDDSAIKANNGIVENPLGDRELDLEDGDGEKVFIRQEQRPRKHIQACVVGVTWIILLTLLGLVVKTLLVEYLYDGNPIRFAYLAYYPVIFLMSMFFLLCIVGSLFYVFGPINQIFRNSFAYSAIPPPRTRSALPHITVQCPVYKESLTTVISKTVDSLAVAMQRYELQGGTCNLLICDDRMQLVDQESARFRKQYYKDNNIGWVARPGHNSDGFLRAGKFKKASNMNFALNISMKVEEALEYVERTADWTSEMEQMAYNDVLNRVLSENPRAQAAGNIRVGDLILLVDSDTRVPTDCLIDAASEFELSPELAILQHMCGVMQITRDYFENGITWFTNYVYRSISLSAAAGDIAPFVGHNAFLRWSAVQEIADRSDPNYVKYWSEHHVSEDFDMALKLQSNDYTLRFATYANGEFEEGVSLTIFDELLRWEKYAYGCSELVFNPFYQWIYRGPFAKTFRDFVGSSMPGFGKFTIIAYIGTYYSLGAVWITTLANYFFTGWYGEHIDHAYLSSFDVMLSLVVVFFALTPIAHAIVRSRMGNEGFFVSLFEGYKWMLFFAVFFGGVSLHISMSLLCHMFSINVEWGATAKELEHSDFFKELQTILKKFKYMYLGCILLIAGMVYLAFFAPLEWRIYGVNSCLPLAWAIIGHMALPAVLNPQLFKSG